MDGAFRKLAGNRSNATETRRRDRENCRTHERAIECPEKHAPAVAGKNASSSFSARSRWGPHSGFTASVLPSLPRSKTSEASGGRKAPWLDEVLSGLREVFGDRVRCLPSPNASLRESLRTLEESASEAQ